MGTPQYGVLIGLTTTGTMVVCIHRLRKTKINLSSCSFPTKFKPVTCRIRRSQWPCCLRRRSAAARLLRSWVRIPPEAWMFFCCKCCVLSGRGLCDELISRPEEFYRLWCVAVCDLETSRMRRPWPALGCSATEKKKDLSNTSPKHYRFNQLSG